MTLTRRTAALAVAAVLATSACGGDDAKDASEATTTTRATPTTADAEVLEPVPSTTTTTIPPGPPAVSKDPATLAAQLTETETKIRSGETVDERTGHTHQLIYRTLVNNPGLKDQVSPLLSAEMRAAMEANSQAGAGLRSMIKPREALPDQWRIVAPAPAEELVGFYKEAEAATGVPWYYMASINLVETRMGRIRGVSSAGAQGPMQFMPATWEQYGNGGDIQSPRDSIHAAARLLKNNGAPGNMENALFNYNRDTRYVRAVINHAHQMRDNERMYFGYYHWQVYYVTTGGDRWLPVGYPEVPSPPAAA
jgi:hypothetical protein